MTVEISTLLVPYHGQWQLLDKVCWLLTNGQQQLLDKACWLLTNGQWQLLDKACWLLTNGQQQLLDKACWLLTNGQQQLLGKACWLLTNSQWLFWYKAYQSLFDINVLTRWLGWLTSTVILGMCRCRFATNEGPNPMGSIRIHKNEMSSWKLPLLYMPYAYYARCEHQLRSLRCYWTLCYWVCGLSLLKGKGRLWQSKITW
jgi:hypothetical protein